MPGGGCRASGTWHWELRVPRGWQGSAPQHPGFLPRISGWKALREGSPRPARAPRYLPTSQRLLAGLPGPPTPGPIWTHLAWGAVGRAAGCPRPGAPGPTAAPAAWQRHPGAGEGAGSRCGWRAPGRPMSLRRFCSRAEPPSPRVLLRLRPEKAPSQCLAPPRGHALQELGHALPGQAPLSGISPAQVPSAVLREAPPHSRAKPRPHTLSPAPAKLCSGRPGPRARPRPSQEPGPAPPQIQAWLSLPGVPAFPQCPALFY